MWAVKVAEQAGPFLGALQVRLSGGSLVALLTRLLYALFLVALLGLAAVLAVALLPSLFGYGSLVVRGGSMGAALPTGSLVVGRWVDGNEIEPGDVILMQEQDPGGQAVPKLHRIITVETRDGQRVVETKGDANDSPDPLLYVLPDRVLTPAYHLPYLGFLVGFLKTPLGWVLLILMPCGLLLLDALRRIWA